MLLLEGWARFVNIVPLTWKAPRPKKRLDLADMVICILLALSLVLEFGNTLYSPSWEGFSKFSFFIFWKFFGDNSGWQAPDRQRMGKKRYDDLSLSSLGRRGGRRTQFVWQRWATYQHVVTPVFANELKPNALRTAPYRKWSPNAI